MIDPAGIPVIDGDMDALAGHARAIGAAGAGFADVGARVHEGWQRLGAYYRAPEAAELTAATGPVMTVTASVGEDLAAAERALVAYSDDVREIQVRLDALRVQASELTATADPADQAALDRSDALIRQVNDAVADFQDAERRCANALNALSGAGPQLRADNGDGVLAPDEYGATAAQLDTAAGAEGGVPWGSTARPQDDGGWSLSDIGHTVLDVAGLVPVLGEAFDGINAAWYLAEGDYVNAGLSAAAMIPIAGWVATGGKLTVRVATSFNGMRVWATNRPSMVPWNAQRELFTPSTAFPHGMAFTWKNPTTGKPVSFHAHGIDPNARPRTTPARARSTASATAITGWTPPAIATRRTR